MKKQYMKLTWISHWTCDLDKKKIEWTSKCFAGPLKAACTQYASVFMERGLVSMPPPPH
jgi:hypothetical protein